jgi:hypothetical protein
LVTVFDGAEVSLDGDRFEVEVRPQGDSDLAVVRALDALEEWAAATPESGRRLYSALSTFRPELELDDEDRLLVVVRFDTDREVAEVLETLHRFLSERVNGDASVSSVCVAMDGH